MTALWGFKLDVIGSLFFITDGKRQKYYAHKVSIPKF